MDYKEIIPFKALRQFNAMCLHNEYLHQNREFQQQILSWAVELLKEAREDWGKLHATTMDAVIKTHHREKAHRGAVVRDKKYAQFRKKFAEIQKEKYKEALQIGIKLTANSFVEWYLANKVKEMQIPYVEHNKKNKLRQLAQQNNREFKKLLLG
ncbi:MAG: hypothetical protein J6Y91_01090 [Alphaproteobacteria bacterium]|nr:hypothetical protein [Alphaproteobacteria bacterium]MBP5352344.1 hypothetical protein [Alphaproteobacteria bacterium]